MTVPATTRRAGPFTGNGVTTSFPFTFKVFEAEDIQFTTADADGLETLRVLDSDYSVTLNPDQDASPGGSVTYPISGTPLASGHTAAISGAVEYTQELDLPGGGSFSPTALENALDRTTMQVQQLVEEVGRSLTLPVTAAGADTELPVPEAGKVIAWNSTATGLVNVDSSDLASVVVAGSAYTDLFDGTGAQTAFTLTSDPGGVNTLTVSISGVVQTNGVDFTVSGTTLTFTSAPPAGTDNILVRYVASVPVGAGNAQDIVFEPSGAGASDTDLQTLLRDAAAVVTVDDYGADPTGSTDSTSAFDAMLTATGRIVMKPFATYLVDAGGYPTKRAVIHKTGGSFYMIGYFSTIKYKNAATGPIGLNFVELTNVEGALIQGVIFDGNSANQSYGYHAIAIMGGQRITVRDCVCKNNYYDGIYVRASTVGTFSTYPTDILFDNVICEGNGRNGASIIGANRITVQGGRYSSSVGDPGAGIDVEPNVSDIYGVRGFKCIGATFSGNDGRGLMITGNVPAGPGETPYCLDADVADITCNGNSAAQDVGIGGCDVGVYHCRSFTLRGYKNVSGETQDPMDAGLVYIHNTVVHCTIDGVEIKGVANPTNTKSGVYIDSSNEPHRWVSNVRVSDSNLVGVSGGKYSVIDNVLLEDVTGNVSVLSGNTDSGFSNVTAVRSSVIQAYNTSGTGAYSIRGVTVIDPTARGLRLYQQGSTVRDIIIRHSGTPATQAVWIESITDCNLSGFTISDAGGYWDTPSNAYLISQASLSGNRLRDMVPSPLSGSTTWTPGLIADGAAASTTVSLLRGDIGDPCRVNTSATLSGLMVSSTVTSANTATVTLFNKTGGGVTPAAGLTLSVEALK